MTTPLSEIPLEGFTHAGIFHADDVFATAVLQLLRPDIRIRRGHEVPDGFVGIAYDVGGGEFDHHQGDPRRRENGVPYASLGLVWERYGRLLLDCDEDAWSFDASFVQPIDDADNGGSPCMLSQLVSDFNPMPPAAPERYDQAFFEAVTWARGVLERRLLAIRTAREARDYVEGRMRASDGKVLVLDRLVPWKEAVVGSGYVYAVCPSPRGGYNVQAVPERVGDFSMVLPLPQAWRGQPSDTLQSLTGIDDLTFCHASGFLCAAGSIEGAMRAARLALAEGHMPKEP